MLPAEGDNDGLGAYVPEEDVTGPPTEGFDIPVGAEVPPIGPVAKVFPIGAPVGTGTVKAVEGFATGAGDDIGAAGGSAEIEQDGGCKAGNCDTVAKFQNRLIGQGLCHGTDHLHCGKDDGIKNADIRCFRTEAFAQNEKANDKQGVADHKVDGGGGEGEIILQNQRQTGDAAEGEIIGEAEKMAAERIDQGAERHDDQFSEPAAAQFDVHYVLPNLS